MKQKNAKNLGLRALSGARLEIAVLDYLAEHENATLSELSQRFNKPERIIEGRLKPYINDGAIKRSPRSRTATSVVYRLKG
jgi:Holliday junction resolvasome RuvABC ATP-dependent DNA helicase subunit